MLIKFINLLIKNFEELVGTKDILDKLKIPIESGIDSLHLRKEEFWINKIFEGPLILYCFTEKFSINKFYIKINDIKKIFDGKTCTKNSISKLYSLVR